ncbi:chemotaxis protein CheB [Ramlibacter sp. USB13]|uniref:protein-glutamate methylesterase n=1 Tax=Ramlibacter cellulosilyticus TaxID=2764187 RepID=A0A923MVB8_9BURK|nr:chemotaxis protein CheB [Ramlibacter cellulosilyticus]MBC5784417.1 chemotaxis protein CheB [Ramlibacter cellulosilyticus]
MKTALPKRFAFAAEAVAIGASAGGIDALFTLLDDLQPPMAAPIIIVLHLPEDHESRLVQVFAQRTRVPVHEAQPGAPAAPGAVYFAPPGYHLLVETDRTFALSCDPPVLFSRPSIDVMMESCAETYGPGLLGMVLTGANEDGAAGLATIKARGGLTAVQDPAEALHATMPNAAIAAADPDFVLPLAGLHRLLHTVACR